ncbi:MAG: hypothetical protein LBR32_03990, partial [Propionibacteriaceae bacterium]|nr:hypothetical protein [Propionibacteriaceae bacterium]
GTRADLPRLSGPSPDQRLLRIVILVAAIAAIAAIAMAVIAPGAHAEPPARFTAQAALRA